MGVPDPRDAAFSSVLGVGDREKRGLTQYSHRGFPGTPINIARKGPAAALACQTQFAHAIPVATTTKGRDRYELALSYLQATEILSSPIVLHSA